MIRAKFMKVKNLVSQNIKYLHLSFIKYHPYRINAGYLLFFETTIMGKTADLAIVQKTIIYTLLIQGNS